MTYDASCYIWITAMPKENKNPKLRNYDPRFIYSLVVKRYFSEMKTKIEIAEELGLSRFKVARLIDEAIAQEYVKFTFPKQQALDEEIAQNLCKNTDCRMPLCSLFLNPGLRRNN